MGYPQSGVAVPVSESQLLNVINSLDREVSRLRDLRSQLELFSQKLESRPMSDEAKMKGEPNIPNDSFLFLLNSLTQNLAKENEKIENTICHYRSLINF